MQRISKRSFLISLGLAVGSISAPQTVPKSVAVEPNFRWDSYHADPQNSGYNPVTSSPVTEFRQDWRFTTQNQIIRSAPVIKQNRLYVGSTDRSLYAINIENGSKEWSFETSSAIIEPPVVINDSIIFLNREGNVYSVDRSEGDEKWSVSNEHYRHTPLPYDGVVYFTARNRVVGLDAQSGETLWASEEMDDIPTTGSAYADGIIFSCVGHTTHAFDISDGTEIWSFDARGRIDVVPTVSENIVYIGSRNNRVYALEAETGEELWDYNTGNPVYSSPAVRNETVYVASFGAENATHAIDSNDGSQEWVFDFGTHGTGGPSLIVTDEVVYVTRSNEIFAVDIVTGKEIDRLRLDNRVSTTPCIVDGVLYFGSRDHTIYAYSGSTNREAKFEVGQFRLFSEAASTDFGDTEITVFTGDEVQFIFSVSNTGIADGEFDAVIMVNDAVIEKQSIEISAGRSEEIRIERTFDESGEFDIILNDTAYGTVLVENEEEREGDSEYGNDEAVVEELPGFGIPAAVASVGGAIAYALYRDDSTEK